MTMKGNRLRDRRIAEGLTITDLARLSNISTKVISQTERLLTDPTEKNSQWVKCREEAEGKDL
jgi:transcriptional regulator with XRE-family HTH domain